MKKRNKSHVDRVKKLIIGCSLCAIILTASTYAWFVGMKTVNVNSFDVKIAAIDGLELSLNGKRWSDTVSINEGNCSTTADVSSCNWGGEGLVPMSTVGKIDSASSRLILFEKGSFATTKGGFRLMASQVQNGVGQDEQRGYVVFDLFIKNLSGAEYYQDLNILNEEDIYLTVDSSVTVSANGGVAGTGIENSARVAFAQIGRVKATVTETDTITGITCASQTDANGHYVTGICANRDAQIWEPNDTHHVTNAVNWYKESCKKRTGATVTDPNSYGDVACNEITATGYDTYAVSGVIGHEDNVDIYDGADYNTYTESVSSSAAKGKLVAYDYFTDTEKSYRGTKRPTFIKLAPNSVTKIRIYIYIEGQDVDNYDFASLGRKITVQFGFTKERYFDEDIDYDDTNTATLPDDVIYDLHTPVQ